MSNNPIQVAIVDDQMIMQQIILEKIAFYSDVDVQFIASDGKEIIVYLESNPLVQLILLDIEMPTMNGIEVTRIVKDLYPQIKILILTVIDDTKSIFEAIKAGAEGYLLKDVNAEDLHKGILETMNGGAAMTPSIAMKTLKLLRNPLSPKGDEIIENNLTIREQEVLEQMSKGLTYKSIASNLFISPSTVRKHIENIYTKLRVRSKLEAVEKARINRII